MAKASKETKSQDRKKVAGGQDYEVKYDNMKKKTSPLKLNMTYEEAMKKALNTPLPKKQDVKKKTK
jgi:uncharacterized short protein YbdD (DUF466 family)